MHWFKRCCLHLEPVRKLAWAVVVRAHNQSMQKPLTCTASALHVSVIHSGCSMCIESGQIIIQVAGDEGLVATVLAVKAAFAVTLTLLT